MWVNIGSWAFGVVYGIDLTLNAIVKGSPRETFSSRCYRLDDKWRYRAFEAVINAIARPFDGADHCKQSYQNIIDGRYLPPGFTNRAVYNHEMDEAIAMNAAIDRGL